MKIKSLQKLVFIFFVSIASNANAALVDGSILTFSAYDGASGSIPANGNGSWFGVQPAVYGVTGISSFDGLIVGTTQVASGSHSGVPNGSESASIDNPHDWYGNTGMLGSVSDTNIVSSVGNTATLDFTGIRWSWGGTDNIVIYDPEMGDTGLASVVCSLDCSNGDTYILDYVGYIEAGSASGLGGEEVRIHLEGTISAVPLPASAWLLSSGLLGLFGLARRKK